MRREGSRARERIVHACVSYPSSAIYYMRDLVLQQWEKQLRLPVKSGRVVSGLSPTRRGRTQRCRARHVGSLSSTRRRQLLPLRMGRRALVTINIFRERERDVECKKKRHPVREERAIRRLG